MEISGGRFVKGIAIGDEAGDSLEAFWETSDMKRMSREWLVLFATAPFYEEKGLTRGVAYGIP
jgi:hypothetical protein